MVHLLPNCQRRVHLLSVRIATDGDADALPCAKEPRTLP